MGGEQMMKKKSSGTNDVTASTDVAPQECGETDRPRVAANTVVSAHGVFSAHTVTDRDVRTADGASDIAVTAPKVLGDFELIERLGEGGMGIVYRARQHSTDRIVALKLIRPQTLSLLTPEQQTKIVERFRVEARACAKLEHDNIVTVYDVGEIEGQHFLSVQYVDGQSLAEVLQKGPIDNRDAARYLEPLARAVYEAHTHGILHRDLKPQNVLVDAGTDRVYVVDFGLAKLMEGERELTQHGEIMGTAQYMSPEQARDSANVTALTDVYALGATFYHMLTGRPPFQAATPMETLRQVLTEEPVPLRHLNSTIDRDLETICLKCLEKEPERRYASAESLADELRRYLDGRPIQARPISVPGRVWRWARRNPLIAALATTAVVLLVVALGATTAGYIIASTAQQRSEESFRDALEAVDDLFMRVSEETLLDQPGMQPLKKDLLERALKYYRRFLRQRAGDPTVRDKVAATYYRVGLINAEIDSPAKAIEWYDSARRIQMQLLREEPDATGQLDALGNTWNAHGMALSKMEKPNEAIAAFQEAVAVRRQAIEQGIDDLESQADRKRVLANSYMNIGILEGREGKFDEALRQYANAQNIRQRLLESGDADAQVRRDYGIGYFNMANLNITLGKLPEAEAQYRQAVAVFDQLLSEDPRHLDDTFRLVVCRRMLGDLAPEAAAAIEQYQKALQRMEPLAHENRSVSQYQFELATIHRNRALCEYDLGHADECLESMQRAQRILEELAIKDPATPKYRRNLANTLQTTASLLKDRGDQHRARDCLERCLRHLQELVDEFNDGRDVEALHESRQLLDSLNGMNDGDRAQS